MGELRLTLVTMKPVRSLEQQGNGETMLKNTITFSVLLMAVSAFGLLLFPSKMLSWLA